MPPLPRVASDGRGANVAVEFVSEIECSERGVQVVVREC